MLDQNYISAKAEYSASEQLTIVCSNLQKLRSRKFFD
jgi:hypothetical protein